MIDGNTKNKIWEAIEWFLVILQGLLLTASMVLFILWVLCVMKGR